jgi:APA family basic amino acid/polyamine antiporter
MYTVNYLAVFVLRIKEPNVERPFRAWGYPWTTGAVLVGSLGFLIAAMHDDAESAWKAAVLMAIALPVYGFMKWKKRDTGTKPPQQASALAGGPGGDDVV